MHTLYTSDAYELHDWPWGGRVAAAVTMTACLGISAVAIAWADSVIVVLIASATLSLTFGPATFRTIRGFLFAQRRQWRMNVLLHRDPLCTFLPELVRYRFRLPCQRIRGSRRIEGILYLGLEGALFVPQTCIGWRRFVLHLAPRANLKISVVSGCLYLWSDGAAGQGDSKELTLRIPAPEIAADALERALDHLKAEPTEAS